MSEQAEILRLRDLCAQAPAAETYFELGVLLRRQGEAAEAFLALEKAVELDPSHHRACKELARLSRDTRELRAFTNWCHEAARIDPHDPEPLVMLGEALADQHRWEEALEALRLAVTLRPMADEDLERVAWLIGEIELRARPQ
jgi:cytochrome c-type biogenesis protein CcmH/NrfG